jgi:hypothetical protein
VLAGREDRPGALGEMGVEILDFQIRHAPEDARIRPDRTGILGCGRN